MPLFSETPFLVFVVMRFLCVFGFCESVEMCTLFGKANLGEVALPSASKGKDDAAEFVGPEKCCTEPGMKGLAKGSSFGVPAELCAWQPG